MNLKKPSEFAAFNQQIKQAKKIFAEATAYLKEQTEVVYEWPISKQLGEQLLRRGNSKILEFITYCAKVDSENGELKKLLDKPELERTPQDLQNLQSIISDFKSKKDYLIGNIASLDSTALKEVTEGDIDVALQKSLGTAGEYEIRKKNASDEAALQEVGEVEYWDTELDVDAPEEASKQEPKPNKAVQFAKEKGKTLSEQFPVHDTSATNKKPKIR